MHSGVTPEALIARARSSTGLEHLGSEHFDDVLRAWCDDLASPRLSPSGREQLARLAARNLQTRLRVEDTLRRHPEILDVTVPRIVRIAGFPRSGTTLLHQLMSLGTGRRPLLRWELVDPVPPPEASTYRNDPRIEKVGRPLDALRGSELERMHWVEASDPEECTWGFLDLSGLLGRGCVGAMPHWADVIYDRGRNSRETYVDYRRLIQLLLWHNPVGPDAVLVLKSPMDTDCLPAFLDVFPEAVALLIHRDPYRTVTSSCRMQQVINQPYLAEGQGLSDEETLAIVVSIQAKQADGMVELSRDRPDDVASIGYADLMADPANVLAELAHKLGLPGDTETVRGLVADFLERQRTGARASPPTDYRSSGATPEMIHGEPSMTRYMTTFGIPEERDRISAPHA